MTSAARGEARLSQVPIEICPSANLSRILLFMNSDRVYAQPGVSLLQRL